MRKIKPKFLVKLLILILGLGLLIFTAQDVYRLLVRTEKTNDEYVQFYRVQLNVALIKQAAKVVSP